MGQETSTRDRLFNTAASLFAKAGYQDTSTREIAEAAGVNIAAINYHFGGKENLYKEVVRAKVRARSAERIAILHAAAVKKCARLEDVISGFVTAHLKEMLKKEQCDLDIPFFFREISNPGPGFSIIVEEMIHPTQKAFHEIISRNYPNMSREDINLCLSSLMGQLVHFVRAKEVIQVILGREYNAEMIDEISKHVVKFTMAGLESYR